MSSIQVTDLRVEITGGPAIVSDVSFSLMAGEVMGLIGESGSGKSTLALALLGYARAGAEITAGSVQVGEVDVLALPPKKLRRARGHLVSYVPQDPATALNPLLPIGIQLSDGLDGRADHESTAHMRSLLERVDLPFDAGFLRKRPSELSGGQQQRVAIAAALVGKPRLLVLDEPTTGLDVITQSRVLTLVAELCHEANAAAVYVSHDLAVVADVTDSTAVMYGGRMLERGPTPEFIRHAGHPYSRALLDAVPSARERLRLRPIAGRAPEVGEAVRGCVFASRCEFVADACRAQEPEMKQVSPGHFLRCVRSDEVAQSPRQPHIDVGLGERRPLAEPALVVTDLSAHYSGRQVVFGASLAVRRGECVAIVGESGSGKTTLSRSVIGLHTDWHGQLTLDGTNLAPHARHRSLAERRKLQYVFQNPYASLNPRRTTGASLAVPLAHFFGVRGPEAHEQIRDILHRVGLSQETATMYPSELSGGQRQRVAIARALLCQPEFLICDEVTSALDVSVQASVVELLRSLQEEGLGMVFVTHDLAVVRSIADQVVVLNRGRLIESGTVSEVLDAPREDYTRSLLAHVVDIIPRGDDAAPRK